MISLSDLPDVQENHAPEVPILINQAGVEKIKLPFLLELYPGKGNYTNLVADVTITTSVPKNKKGISMSRLLLTLNNHLELPLNRVLINHVVKDIAQKIESDDCYIKFDFDLPIVKWSPTTDNKFPIYHKCTFAGKLRDGIYRFFQGATIQYASYCPCSAELSKNLAENGFDQGFPHAQRSFANILLEMDLENNNLLWLEHIIEIAYDVLKTQPYPIIKRTDEQEIAKIASQNPMFVEDAVRLLSREFNKVDNIKDWIIKCVHEESIHTHNAIAIMWKGVENGFDGRKYI